MFDPNALPFTGYQQDPATGGYQFQRPDGSTLLSSGDEAKRIAGLIDRYGPPPDQRLAQNDAALGNAVTAAGDTTARNIAAQPVMSPGAQPMPARAPAPPVRDLGDVDARGFAPPPPAQVGNVIGNVVNSDTPMAPRGLEATPPANLAPTYHPAAQPGQAAAGAAPRAFGPPVTMPVPGRAGPARFVPTTRGETIEGGIQDPAMAAQTAGMYGRAISDEQKAADANAAMLNAQKNAADLQAAAAVKQAQDLETQRIGEEAHRATVGKLFGDQMLAKQNELDAESKREVDQFRPFRGKPGAQALAVISSVLGGLAQGLSKGALPNAGADAINKIVDNDIQAQRDEIQRGVSSKQNDLARIRDKYGLDMEDSSRLLNMIYTDKAKAVAAQQAARLGSAQAQQGLIKLQTGLDSKQLQLNNEAQSSIYGKTTRKTDERFQQPGGLGFRPGWQTDKATGRDIFVGKDGKVEQYRGPDGTIYNSGGEPHPKAAGTGRASPAGATVAAQKAAIDDAANNLGYEKDKDGKLVPVGKGERAGFGTGWFGSFGEHVERAFGAKDERQRAQSAHLLATAAATSPNGRINSEQRDDYESRIMNARSPEEKTQIVNQINDVVNARDKALSSGPGGGTAGGGTEEPDPETEQANQ